MRTGSLLSSGMALSKAGAGTKLFHSWEVRLLKLGELHGRMDLVLTDISRYYENSSIWWRKLRTKLILPAAVLLLGMFILPLAQLFSGKLNLYTYIAINSITVIVISFGWKRIVCTETYPRILDFTLALGKLGQPVVMFHQIRFLNALSVLIEAGVPAHEAVQAAVTSCHSPRLRASWHGILKSLREGCTLAQSLHRHHVLNQAGYALIDSGEASGKIVEMLKVEIKRLENEMQLKLEIIADWLPRVIYIVALMIVFAWV